MTNSRHYEVGDDIWASVGVVKFKIIKILPDGFLVEDYDHERIIKITNDRVVDFYNKLMVNENAEN